MKRKNKKILICSILLCFFSVLFITSYGFFEFEGKTNSVVIRSGIINMTINDDTALNLTGDFPMEYDDVLELENNDDSTDDHLMNFKLQADNDSFETFYYSLQIVEGTDVSGKNRIDSEYVRFDLYEKINGTDYYYLRNVKLDDYLGMNIIANKIEGSSDLNRDFYLRAWIGEDLVVGNSTSAVMTDTEFSNSFCNIYIKVDCDSTEKETIFSYIAKASKRNDAGFAYSGSESTKSKTAIYYDRYYSTGKWRPAMATMANDETNRRPHFFFANYKFFKDKFPSTTTINFKQVSSSIIDNYFDTKIKANDLAPDYSETDGTLDSNDTSDTADFFDHTDYNYDGHRTIGYFNQIGTDASNNPIYEYNIISDGIIMFPEDASNMFNLDVVVNPITNTSTTVKTLPDMGYHYNSVSTDTEYTIDCLENIEYINFDNVYTGNTTNFGYLFMDLQNLKEIDLSKLDTHNGVNMAGLFCWCKSLTELDVNYLDLSRATNIGWIFSGLNLAISEDGTVDDFCGGLQNLDVHRVTTITDIFTDCPNIEKLDLRNWYTGTLEYFGSNTTDPYQPYLLGSNAAYMSDSSDNIIYTYYTGPIMGQYTTYNDAGTSNFYTLKYLDISNFDVSNITSMAGTFYCFRKMHTLKIDNWDTSNVTYFGSFLYRCKDLVNFDASCITVTNKAKYLNDMFYDCNSLATIDVTNYDTSKALNVSNMFYGCSSITTLNVSNFDTSKANSMYDMFMSCTNLTEIIGLDNLDTSAVNDNAGLAYMFYGCSSLKSIDISSWSYENVFKLNYMFFSCTSLETVNLGAFPVTKNLTTMECMFKKCSSLISVIMDTNVTGTFTGVTTMKEMFYGCTNLTNLDLSKFSYSFSNLSNMNLTFYGCANLELIDLSNILINNGINLTSCFNECTKLVTIYVPSSLNLSNRSISLFNNCLSLVGGNGTRYIDMPESTRNKGDFARIDTAAVLDTDGVTVLTAAIPGYFSVKSSS